MTTNNPVRILQREKDRGIPSAAPRLSKRLVPARRKPDESKEVAAEHQLSSICESLRQQLGERTSQLQAALANLTKSNLEFQQFANSVSHDLQTPLRAISGFSQYLQQEYQGELDETADGYIHQIVGGASRMEQLIKGLIQFSRVTSKAAPLESVNLNEVLEDALVALQDRIDDGNAVVTRNNLPIVMGDRAQLTLLLKSLIENGLQFNNSETPTIHVGAGMVDDHWILGICDNGIGIAKNHLDCVFDIFRRLNVRQEYEGVGAGLAICRRIVDRHMGQVWLDSEEGIGTQASIRLSRT